MPWKEITTMSQRLEFIMLASQEGANLSLLCERYGISRKTAYKWLRRFRAGGDGALQNRSRRPLVSPRRTSPPLEEAIVQVRQDHPAWGGRKIRAFLERQGLLTLPSPSTITAILWRHGLIDAEEARKHEPYQRFEAARPNDLWQMDFKGHVPLAIGRCHPLTVLDDHSRFALGIRACGDETGKTVQGHLTAIFSLYGLPRRILVDNGSPWGYNEAHSYTPLTVWFMLLGIEVSHSRPYHPQTLGKDERFHRTLLAEVIRNRLYQDLSACQRHFDLWRELYNCERPHEALGMAVPADRYQTSVREFPAALPSVEYGPGDSVRKVQAQGEISFHGHLFRVPRALRGYTVALRPTVTDGVYAVHFCQQKVAQIDLAQHNAPGQV